MVFLTLYSWYGISYVVFLLWYFLRCIPATVFLFYLSDMVLLIWYFLYPIPDMDVRTVFLTLYSCYGIFYVVFLMLFRIRYSCYSTSFLCSLCNTRVLLLWYFLNGVRDMLWYASLEKWNSWCSLMKNIVIWIWCNGKPDARYGWLPWMVWASSNAEAFGQVGDGSAKILQTLDLKNLFCAGQEQGNLGVMRWVYLYARRVKGVEIFASC